MFKYILIHHFLYKWSIYISVNKKIYSELLILQTYLACCDCANISDSPGTDCAVSLALYETEQLVILEPLHFESSKQGHKIFSGKKLVPNDKSYLWI